jgi:hypothetical protein
MDANQYCPIAAADRRVPYGFKPLRVVACDKNTELTQLDTRRRGLYARVQVQTEIVLVIERGHKAVIAPGR